ncbi:hypothetical protein [Lichenicoccus sp.]|uniref:hypothetical protein n=1 Tax=Lichenicoccus sp. TaxID=2781899 RepID=UPI003D14C3DE
MKRLGIATVALVAVLAVGWLILDQMAKSRLQSSIAQARASLRPDGSFTYATARAAPLRLGADFTNLQVRWGAVTLQVKTMSLSHVLGNRVGSAVLDDARVADGGLPCMSTGLRSTTCSPSNPSAPFPRHSPTCKSAACARRGSTPVFWPTPEPAPTSPACRSTRFRTIRAASRRTRPRGRSA